MLKLLHRTREVPADFCDRCASACDSRCHADALRHQTLHEALLYGWRHA